MSEAGKSSNAGLWTAVVTALGAVVVAVINNGGCAVQPKDGAAPPAAASPAAGSPAAPASNAAPAAVDAASPAAAIPMDQGAQNQTTVIKVVSQAATKDGFSPDIPRKIFLSNQCNRAIDLYIYYIDENGAVSNQGTMWNFDANAQTYPTFGGENYLITKYRNVVVFGNVRDDPSQSYGGDVPLYINGKLESALLSTNMETNDYGDFVLDMLCNA